MPANLSLCAATICTDGGLLVVPDLSGDEAWESHPFVADAPRLRFYAGATITVDQQPIGVGDHVLCDVAHGLRTACREVDTVARLGGDEFVIVCPNLAGAEYLDTIVQRLAGTTYSRDFSPGLHEPLRLSVGAVLAEDDETVAAVLHRGDAGMYRARSAFKQSDATSSS